MNSWQSTLVSLKLFSFFIVFQSNTGIKVCDEFADRFEALKTSHTVGYLVLAIKDNKAIVIEKEGEPFVPNTGEIEVNKKAYLDLIETITEKDDPKYILFDFQHIKKDGGRREKIVFINW